MIFDWIAIAPVILVTVGILFVPGAFCLYFLGLRGIALAALSPVLGTAIVGASSFVSDRLNLVWSPLSFGVFSGVLVLASWLISRAMVRPLSLSDGGRGSSGFLLIALGIGVALGAWRLVSYISDPTAISQTNDAVFHLNAVRHVLETGSASPFHLTSVIGSTGFYPAAWHGVVSLVVLATGAEISVAANAFTVVIGAVVWPLGIAWMTAVITRSRAVAAYAAILSSALQAFPLLLFQWGVLYPNALSVSLLPASVAVVVSLPRWYRTDHPWGSRIRSALLVGIAFTALVLSQPASALAWGLLVLVWAAGCVFRRDAPLRRLLRAGAVALGGFALAAAWLFFSRSTGGAHWPAFRSKTQGALEVALNGQVLTPYAFGVSALMIVGLITAILRPSLRWLAVAWAAISVLYFAVAAIQNPLLRHDLLGAWYADPYRLAALVPIAVIPLAAIGVDTLLGVVRRIAGATDASAVRFSSFQTASGIVLTTAFMVALILLRPVAMPAFLDEKFDEYSRYLATDESFLSIDERALLDVLDEYVDTDSRVLGNPSAGAGFGYAVSGRDVFPRTWSPPSSEAWQVLADRLRDAAADPAVCEALAEFGDPEYVLDFGSGDVGSGRFDMPGLTDFSGQPGFELIARSGDASLWRISACAL